MSIATRASHRTLRLAVGTTLCTAILTLVGCGGGTLTGRVLGGESSFIQWVKDTRSAGGGEPVAGAAISVVRDPLSPGRQAAGNAVSGADGSFTLKLDAFGAGWTDEDWLIVVERRGVGRAEYIGRLESGELLVLLAPGSDRTGGANELWNGNVGSMPSGSSLMEEVKRYR
jgi:hypothetical protein